MREARGSAGQLRVHEERRDPRLDPARGPVLLEHRRDPRTSPSSSGSPSRKDHARVFVWRRPNGRRITRGLRRAAHAVLRGAARGGLAGDPQVPRRCRTCASTARRPTTSRRSACTSPSASTARSVTDADLETLDGGARAPARELGRPAARGWCSSATAAARERAATRRRATSRPPRRAQEIWTRYGARFPDSYKGTLPPEIALLDIGLIEKLDDTEGLRVALVAASARARARHTSLRIVSRKELLLNDVVPSLHRMALRTTSRLAERLEPGHRPDVYITGFEVTGADGRKIEDDATLERLGAIMQRVLVGQLLDDRLLGLGYLAEPRLAADRSADHLPQLLRAGVPGLRHAERRRDAAQAPARSRRCSSSTSRPSSRPSARRRPPERAEKLLPPLARKYDELLQRVTVIQEDLILRYFIDLFEATRRTNYYRPGRGDTISIKIESALVEHMPRPVPAVRDLRPRARRRGHPPARRQGRARRSPPLAIAPTTSAPRCSACSARRR